MYMNIVCYCLQIMQISLMSRTMVQLTGLCLCPFAHYYSCQLLFLASSSLHLLLFLILFCQPIEPLNTFCHPLDANLFKCFYHCKNVFMLWKVTCSNAAVAAVWYCSIFSNDCWAHGAVCMCRLCSQWARKNENFSRPWVFAMQENIQDMKIT